MKCLYGITINELEKYFMDKGEGKFKATQVFEWLYKKRIHSFQEMRNVRKKTISDLENDFSIEPLKVVTKKNGKNVSKYLFELEDGNRIEAVLMLHDYGNSLCISTQVGCNMGCHFCESGRLKKVRNLDASEMVRQVLCVEEDLNLRITHIVLMGIGEPFDNYKEVISFVDIVNTPKGIDIGSRHITISTSGIVPKIKEFALYPKQVNLAISLHAPNNEIRNQIMDINKAYPIEELMEAVRFYLSKTNRRVTFEYILLKDVNDSRKNAHELATILSGINCYVNLIPYNETSHIEYKKSDSKTILDFYDELKKNGVNVTIRKEFGGNVSAACGQLRSNYKEE